MYSFFYCLEQRECAREADASWMLPGATEGDLNSPRECYQPGVLRTGWETGTEKAQREHVHAEQYVRKVVHPACRSIA